MFLDAILGQKLVPNHWFSRSNSIILEDVGLSKLHQAFKKQRLKSSEMYTCKFSRRYENHDLDGIPLKQRRLLLLKI